MRRLGGAELVGGGAPTVRRWGDLAVGDEGEAPTIVRRDVDAGADLEAGERERHAAVGNVGAAEREVGPDGPVHPGTDGDGAGAGGVVAAVVGAGHAVDVRAGEVDADPFGERNRRVE